VAEAAARRGARVILVSGPTALAVPAGVELERVRTAEEMQRAVLARLGEASIVVAAAAVADFRPKKVQARKIRRRRGRLRLELEPTPDILAAVAQAKEKGKRVLVGFAAETEDLVKNARAKLRAKRLDIVLANDVTQAGAGFDVETNQVTLVTRDGQTIPLPKMSKLAVAHRLLDEVYRLAPPTAGLAGRRANAKRNTP